MGAPSPLMLIKRPEDWIPPVVFDHMRTLDPRGHQVLPLGTKKQSSSFRWSREIRER